MIRLIDDGAWCWFQEPRARRHVGRHDRTYTGWITRDGDVVVARYDHDTGEVADTVVHPEFEEDDHDAPTFFIDREGRVLVFYTGHHGPEIHFRRSEAPEDISSFGPDRTISPGDRHTTRTRAGSAIACTCFTATGRPTATSRTSSRMTRGGPGARNTGW